MRALFAKFRDGLRKSTPTFFKAFSALGGLLGNRPMDAAAIDELEEALYGADFGPETTAEIIDEIRAAWRRDRTLHSLGAAQIGSTVLSRVLAGAEGRWSATAAASSPSVIALIGINGSGKTTTTAKLGHLFKNDGLVPMIAACDTFRAAANEQIRAWCDRLHIELVASHHGADAAAVAFDGLQAARARKADVLLLDTAGRLHNKSHLMQELAKIRRVLGKLDPTAPHHAWLVLDGSIGSNSIEQARVFHREFGITGLIVTKLDGTSRGGAIASIYRELKIPVFFVGLGEQADDLQPFSIELYSRAIFGLGDRHPDTV
jgi:fused signal recognition particle receptor